MVHTQYTLPLLSEDRSVGSSEMSKLKGYYLKWTNAKYLLGCALFVDLLTPCSILSKVMRHDDLDILSVLSSLLQSVKEIEKLSMQLHYPKCSAYSATLGNTQRMMVPQFTNPKA